MNKNKHLTTIFLPNSGLLLFWAVWFLFGFVFLAPKRCIRPQGEAAIELCGEILDMGCSDVKTKRPVVAFFGLEVFIWISRAFPCLWLFYYMVFLCFFIDFLWISRLLEGCSWFFWRICSCVASFPSLFIIFAKIMSLVLSLTPRVSWSERQDARGFRFLDELELRHDVTRGHSPGASGRDSGW